MLGERALMTNDPVVQANDPGPWEESIKDFLKLILYSTQIYWFMT